MPAYNAEMHLQEALDSVLNQSLREIELILIDDCSSDNTINIVRSNALMDDRVRIYENKIRQGAPYSRNLGIDVAKGEYLFFCDADDWMHNELLEKAYEKLAMEHVDFIELPCVRVTDIDEFHRGNYKMYDKEPYMLQYLYEKPVLEIFCSNFWWTTSTWLKIYNYQFVKDNELYFQNLSSSNDVYFSSMAYFLAKKIIQLIDVPEIAYYNRCHTGIDRISANREPINVFLAWMRILYELIQRDILEKSVDYFTLYGTLMMCGGSFDKVDAKKKREYYDFLYEVGLNNLIEIVKTNTQEEHRFVIRIVELLRNSIISEKGREQFNKLRILLEYISLYNNENIWGKLLANKKIGIWGFGNYGKTIIEMLEKSEIPYHHIFDKNIANSKAVNIDGHMIESYNETSQVDVILVSSDKYYDEICCNIRSINLDVEVVNVFDYVREQALLLEEKS